MTAGTNEDTGFAELGLRDELLKALTTLGYEEPTPIQREAIPPMLAGRDLLGLRGAPPVELGTVMRHRAGSLGLPVVIGHPLVVPVDRRHAPARGGCRSHPGAPPRRRTAGPGMLERRHECHD